MDINDLLYYGVMANDNKQAANALAQVNARWKLLVDIHHDLQERFIDKVLVQLNDKDKLMLIPRLKKIATLKQYVFDHMETVEARYLHQYAFCLKEAAMLAIKMCKKYKVYDDIESFKYNAETKMVELNGEGLYFLGEAKGQLKANASLPIKNNHTCTKCDSHNLVKVSELYHEQASNPTYAPPIKKFAFFGAFLTCFFLGTTWFAVKGSMNGSGEILYLPMLVGLACLGYTIYAFHYNVTTFSSARKQWTRSFFCNDCGSISFGKS